MFELGGITQPTDHSKNRSKGGHIFSILYLDTFSGHLVSCLRKLQKPLEELPSLHCVNSITEEDHFELYLPPYT